MVAIRGYFKVLGLVIFRLPVRFTLQLSKNTIGGKLCGIHKDDMEIYLNRNRARFFASQGQQRTLVLALKLGELGIIQAKTGYAPILLLDDVLAELDETRQNYLLKSIETIFVAKKNFPKMYLSEALSVKVRILPS